MQDYMILAAPEQTWPVIQQYFAGKGFVYKEYQGEMVFQKGVNHQSLYQMDVGAMMLTVCARQIDVHITDRGGIVDLVYDIEIENCAAGMVEYHLDIRAK